MAFNYNAGICDKCKKLYLPGYDVRFDGDFRTHYDPSCNEIAGIRGFSAELLIKELESLH